MQIVVAAATPAPAFDLAALAGGVRLRDAHRRANGVFQRSPGRRSSWARATYRRRQRLRHRLRHHLPAQLAALGHLAHPGQRLCRSRPPAGAHADASPFEPKAIHDEMGAAYDEYGRMSGKLGLELPSSPTPLNQTFVLQNFVDPPTEIVDDSVQRPWPATLGRRDADLEDHPQRRRHPPHPLPPVRRAADQPRRLGRRHPAARRQRAGLEGHRPDQPAGGHHRGPAGHRRPSMPFGIPDSVRPLNPASPIGIPDGLLQHRPAHRAAAGAPPT